MTGTQGSSNTQISAEEKRHFPASTSETPREPKIKLSNPDLVRAKVVDGNVIVPASWRDDDGDGDDETMPTK